MKKRNLSYLKKCALTLALVFVSLVGAVSPVLAEEQVAIAPSAFEAEPPKPTTAFKLALGGSLLGPVLFAGGVALNVDESFFNDDIGYALGLVGVLSMVVSPSAGYYYTGEWGKGLIHTGIRLGGSALAVGAFGNALNCEYCSRTEFNTSMALTFLGLGILVADTVYTVVDAKPSARRRRDRNVTLIPTIFPATNRQTGFGLAAVGRF